MSLRFVKKGFCAEGGWLSPVTLSLEGDGGRIGVWLEGRVAGDPGPSPLGKGLRTGLGRSLHPPGPGGAGRGGGADEFDGGLDELFAFDGFAGVAVAAGAEAAFAVAAHGVGG